MITEHRDIKQVSSARAFPASCEYGLKLRRSTSTYDVSASQQAWRMVIEVVEANNVDPNIFLYDRRPRSDEEQDVFLAVCSPVDLEDWPAAAPDASLQANFFRMADVDLITRNRDLLDLTWEGIVADATELVRTLTEICELGVTEDIEIGIIEESSESSSASSESSESSSSTPGVCAADAVTALEIIASDDPEFPVGATFASVGSQGPWIECERVWELAADVDPTLLLRLTTGLPAHAFVLDAVVSGTPTEIDSGGLANGYKAILQYARDQINYVVRIEAA